MNLKEYQGKILFGQFGIPTPKGILFNKKGVKKIDPFQRLKANEVVLKAQIPYGKRGKGGGILFAKKKDFWLKLNLLFAKKINNFCVEEILVEEKIEIEKEFYLALTLDRINKGLLVVFSSMGGVDIEKVAQKYPHKIIKIPLATTTLAQKIPSKILSLTQKLIKLCLNKNALLAEINPLILTTDNKLVAADAKVIIDDNSLEQKQDFSFVELEGNIGVIGNGAGLVMSTLDTLAYFGGRAANFLDIGGGAGKRKMAKAIKTILNNRNVKGMLVNIFGGITQCDQIALGIVNYYQSQGIKIPFVVRLVGTNEKRGRAILKKAGIGFVNEMDKSAQKIINLVENGNPR